MRNDFWKKHMMLGLFNELNRTFESAAKDFRKSSDSGRSG